MLLLNLTVKERILDSVCFDDPHLVWRHLRSTFYRDSPYNFAVEQYKVHSLHARVDVGKPLTEYIERYESEYAKLLNLMKSSKDSFYSVEYYGVMIQDKAKRNLLLSALVPHIPLLADNLMSSHPRS